MNQYILKVFMSFLATSLCAFADDGVPKPSTEQTVAPDSDEALRAQGEQVYRSMCASCHGDKGQGVADAYADPLVGDDSVDN